MPKVNKKKLTLLLRKGAVIVTNMYSFIKSVVVIVSCFHMQNAHKSLQILGPLLFLVCINDLRYATRKSLIHHVADDKSLVFIQ